MKTIHVQLVGQNMKRLYTRVQIGIMVETVLNK